MIASQSVLVGKRIRTHRIRWISRCKLTGAPASGPQISSIGAPPDHSYESWAMFARIDFVARAYSLYGRR